MLWCIEARRGGVDQGSGLWPGHSPNFAAILDWPYFHGWFLQRNDLAVSETRLQTQSGGDEEGKDNGPNEAALLQTTVSQLTRDVEELKQLCVQKDSEISRLQSQLADSAAGNVRHVFGLVRCDSWAVSESLWCLLTVCLSILHMTKTSHADITWKLFNNSVLDRDSLTNLKKKFMWIRQDLCVYPAILDSKNFNLDMMHKHLNSVLFHLLCYRHRWPLPFYTAFSGPDLSWWSQSQWKAKPVEFYFFPHFQLIRMKFDVVVNHFGNKFGHFFRVRFE